MIYDLLTFGASKHAHAHKTERSIQHPFADFFDNKIRLCNTTCIFSPFIFFAISFTNIYCYCVFFFLFFFIFAVAATSLTSIAFAQRFCKDRTTSHCQNSQRSASESGRANAIKSIITKYGPVFKCW